MNKLRTKIRTKLLLLIIITGLASALLFQGMWNCRWEIWDVLSDAGLFDDILPNVDDNFWNNLLIKLQIMTFLPPKRIPRQSMHWLLSSMKQQTNIPAYTFIL